MKSKKKPAGEDSGRRVNLTLRAFKAEALDSLKRHHEEGADDRAPSKRRGVGSKYTSA